MSSVIQVKVPVLPESIQDATIATWHKKPGDTVKRDENLVDLETDKVVLEVPAPADGILKEVLKAEGATVTAQEVLASIDSSTAAVADNKATTESKKAKDSKPAKDSKDAKDSKEVKETKDTTTKEVKEQKSSSSATDLSPSARRAASATGTNVSSISGSGKDGRVTKQDILHGNQTQTDGTQVRPEKRVPMTRLRAKIADRLVQSQRTAAILTTFNEINMQPVMNIRARYKDEFEKVHGSKLGFMSFFIKATVEALKRSPDVNASIDGNDIVYHGYFDIGVAVSSDRGLVVPIIRDADRKSMAEIENEIRDFGIRAQKGQLSIEEMTGGTFTVSNGGVFGSLLSTPIINPPQSGILGMHKIEERPIVENKEIVIRPMMYVAMSYDHRIIDGKESVTFLRTIKELLEDPTRLLLDV